ncbi:MAG: hypothetical protein ACREOO_18285, partial [bacterium]
EKSLLFWRKSDFLGTNAVEEMGHMPRRGKISQAQGNALGTRATQSFFSPERAKQVLMKPIDNPKPDHFAPLGLKKLGLPPSWGVAPSFCVSPLRGLWYPKPSVDAYALSRE